MERRFDVQAGEQEFHDLIFSTPQAMAEWLIAHGISTTVVSALWYFLDLKDWVCVEGIHFIRNAPKEPEVTT